MPFLSQHFGWSSVVQGMDDIKLMMGKLRGDELLRKAEQRRRAAQARCAARNRQSARETGASVDRPAHWLATVVGRMRPTTAGR
jgi:hypothetical protein